MHRTSPRKVPAFLCRVNHAWGERFFPKPWTFNGFRGLLAVLEMTYKLTIDSNLMDPGLKVSGMEVLKRWRDEGKIDLTVADRPTEKRSTAHSWPGVAPLPQPKAAWRGKARAGKMVSSGNATFSSVAAVLFPFRDADKLNMSEMNNVIHIINHHLSKNEIFVTANVTSFIADGRREKLKGSLGVVAMTPEETVRMLDELEGWIKPKSPSKDKKANEKT